MPRTPKPWSPDFFKRTFLQDTHAALSRVYSYTKEAVIQCSYMDEDGQWRKLTLAPLEAPTVFDGSHPAPEIVERGQRAMHVEVWNEDCLYAAKRIIETEGARLLVLNMASFRNPGGGVDGGAGAQEEDLFRRSNYMMSLNPIRFEAYPLHVSEGAIVSGNVTVFREGKDKGYQFMQHPFQVDFIAVAAQHLPDGTRSLTTQQRELLSHKVRVLLRAAYATGHTHLVLSALGCGAFHNPPAEVADIFANVFKEAEFAGNFEHIVFAIIDDHNARGEGNYAPFKRAFQTRTNL